MYVGSNTYSHQETTCDTIWIVSIVKKPTQCFSKSKMLNTILTEENSQNFGRQ